MAESDVNQIVINIKTTHRTVPILVDRNADIKNLRELVAKKFKICISSVVLIFAGKILNDTELLTFHKIGNGLAVHLVEKQSCNQNVQQTDNSSQTTSRLILQRPSFELDLVRIFEEGTPRLRALVQQVPDFLDFLNKLNVLRQRMELAHNPSRLQGVQRIRDQADDVTSNAELEMGRIHLMHSLNRQLRESTFSTTALDNKTSSTKYRAQQGLNTSRDGILLARSNFSAPAGQSSTTVSPSGAPKEASVITEAIERNPLLANVRQGMLRSIMSEFRKLLQRPELLYAMFNNEALEDMLQIQYSLKGLHTPALNTELLNSMARSNENTLSATTIAIQMLGDAYEQFQMAAWRLNELCSEQRMDRSAESFNEQVKRRYAFIQNGLQRMQLGAKAPIPGVPLPRSFLGIRHSWERFWSTKRINNASTTTLVNSNGAGSVSTRGRTSLACSSSDSLIRLVDQFFESNAPSQEIRYRVQLEQLAKLGFNNRNANLQILIKTAGDVEEAVKQLKELNR